MRQTPSTTCPPLRPPNFKVCGDMSLPCFSPPRPPDFKVGRGSGSSPRVRGGSLGGAVNFEIRGGGGDTEGSGG